MKRRLQNVRPKKTKQGAMPQRSRFFKQQLVDKRGEYTAAMTEIMPVRDIDEDELLQNVQDFLGPQLSTYPSANLHDVADDRNMDMLRKESGKKTSDPSTIDLYMDLLFTKRRHQIQSSNIENRLNILEKDYQIMKSQPDQVSHKSFL